MCFIILYFLSLEKVLTTWFCVYMFDDPMEQYLNNLCIPRAQCLAYNGILWFPINVYASILVSPLQRKWNMLSSRILRVVNMFNFFRTPIPWFILICDTVGPGSLYRLLSSRTHPPLIHGSCSYCRSSRWHTLWVCWGEPRLSTLRLEHCWDIVYLLWQWWQVRLQMT